MWLAIDAALKKSGMIADKACKDPARFSRSPNAIRDNGNKQKLMLKLQLVKHYMK